MNKLSSLVLLLCIILTSSCKTKKSDNNSNGSGNDNNDDSICQVLNGSSQCGGDDQDPVDPPPTDDDQDPADPPPVTNSFEVIDSRPEDLVSDFHVDDQIEIAFNKLPDTENLTINSGTALDIISLKDENDQTVLIDLNWSGHVLFIKSRHSLIPNHEYNLTISNELRDTDGEYLNGNFYLKFYTEGEPMNPGTSIEISFNYDQSNEDNNYNQYVLGFDPKSRFNQNGIMVRDYDHKTHFNTLDTNFYYDMDLNKNFYNTQLNLLSGTRYHFALKVCHEVDTDYCSVYSNEIAILPNSQP